MKKFIRAIGWLLFCFVIGFMLNLGGRLGREVWPEDGLTVQHVVTGEKTHE